MLLSSRQTRGVALADYWHSILKNREKVRDGEGTARRRKTVSKLREPDRGPGARPDVLRSHRAQSEGLLLLGGRLGRGGFPAQAWPDHPGVALLKRCPPHHLVEVLQARRLGTPRQAGLRGPEPRQGRQEDHRNRQDLRQVHPARQE